MRFFKAGYFTLAGIFAVAASVKVAQEIITVTPVSGNGVPFVAVLGMVLFALPPLLLGFLCFGVLLMVFQEA